MVQARDIGAPTDAPVCNKLNRLPYQNLRSLARGDCNSHTHTSHLPANGSLRRGTRGTADHRAAARRAGHSWTYAYPARTDFVSQAGMATRAAVINISTCVCADTVAHRGAERTLTCPVYAGCVRRAMVAAAAAVVGVAARVCAGTAALSEAGWADALTCAGIENLPIRADVGDARVAAGHGARGTCTSKGTGIAVAQAALTGLGTIFADACALRQGCTSSAETKYPPHSRSDGLERLAARGRCRKRFCKYIKLRRVHLLSPPLVNMRAPSRRLGARSRW